MAALVNLAVNLVCIRFWGIYAASVSTLVAYFVLAVYRFFSVKKICRITYRVKEILICLFLLGLALISICMFISSLTESQVISAVISLGVLIFLLVLPMLTVLIPSAPLASFICFIVVAALISVLLWRLTKNPNAGMIAAIVLVVPTCAVYFFKSAWFEDLFPTVLSKLSLYSQFYNLNSGIFDIKSVVYLLSVTAFFQFLCVQSLERRRWI